MSNMTDRMVQLHATLRHLQTKPSLRDGSDRWIAWRHFDCYDGRTMAALARRGLLVTHERGFRVL